MAETCEHADCNGANGASASGEDLAGDFAPLLRRNRQWRAAMQAQDPHFFASLANTQTPEYLWIGCADSRVPANQILDLRPGEVFVQRNVGNLATHKDMNCMACLEYAVDSLKVKHVMVVGHYNCGAVKAALAWEPKTPGLVNLWCGPRSYSLRAVKPALGTDQPRLNRDQAYASQISDVRDTRNAHEDELQSLSFDERWDRLCELNVVRQVFNVCTSPIVQAAWARGQPLGVHGLIYHPGEGHLKELTGTVNGPEGVTSPASMEAAARAPGASAGRQQRLTEQVTEDLRVHMSFTQPARVRPKHLGPACQRC